MSTEVSEADEVVSCLVALPTGTFEVSDEFPVDTEVQIVLHAKVNGVRIERDRKGNLIRKHMVTLEVAPQILDSLTPAQRRAILEAALAAEAEGQTGDVVVQ